MQKSVKGLSEQISAVNKIPQQIENAGEEVSSKLEDAVTELKNSLEDSQKELRREVEDFADNTGKIAEIIKQCDKDANLVRVSVDKLTEKFNQAVSPIAAASKLSAEEKQIMENLSKALSKK